MALARGPKAARALSTRPRTGRSQFQWPPGLWSRLAAGVGGGFEFLCARGDRFGAGLDFDHWFALRLWCGVPRSPRRRAVVPSARRRGVRSRARCVYVVPAVDVEGEQLPALDQLGVGRPGAPARRTGTSAGPSDRVGVDDPRGLLVEGELDGREHRVAVGQLLAPPSEQHRVEPGEHAARPVRDAIGDDPAQRDVVARILLDQQVASRRRSSCCRAC